jgi:hypothetical protein
MQQAFAAHLRHVARLYPAERDCGSSPRSENGTFWAETRMEEKTRNPPSADGLVLQARERNRQSCRRRSMA